MSRCVTSAIGCVLVDESDAPQAAKPTLPSFWTPSITPSSNTRDTLHDIVKKPKSTPVCPASPEDDPHVYSLHTLVSVNFTEDKDDGGSKKRAWICPSCKRGLSNASKAMLAKPCGHVLCRNCIDRFVRSAGKHHDPHAENVDPDEIRCFVCDADLTDGKRGSKSEKAAKKDKEKVRPGLVELRSEGTGYAAVGANRVQKSGVAFQC